MGNPPNFYGILNIPKDSSPQEIRNAYISLVKKWHPDKHPLSSKHEAEAMFKAITQAYEALNDQEYRSTMFDNAAASATGGGGGGGGVAMKQRREESTPKYDSATKYARTPGRDFKEFYYSKDATAGMAMPARPAAKRKPPPQEKKLECTLEELCKGCKKEIKFTRDVVAKNGLIIQKQESQKIRVKPGWKKGTKIIFEGLGDERPGCLPADVMYLISEKEHPIYKRVGNDLVLKVEIPLVSALAGWTFSFRLLTGEKMTCSFHDEIIYPGYEKVIQGHGMPIASEKGKRGDLRIKFHINFPTQLSFEQKATLMEILKD